MSVEPWELRALAAREACPEDARRVLSAAADELVGLRRQVEAWKDAHAAALALIQTINDNEGGRDDV